MIIPKSVLLFAIALNCFLLMQSVALEDTNGTVIALASGLLCFLALKLKSDEP
jgi:hypothetical protein